MKTKIIAAIVFVVLVVGGLAAVKALQIKKMIEGGKSRPTPSETVTAVVSQEEQWPVTLRAIGSVTAVQGVTVTTEIPGMVREIAFEGGATVAQGDCLVKLDTSSEEAQLRAIEAQVELARVNLEREKSLRAEKTVSQSDLDAAEATYKQNLANADAVRATIQKKTLRAPFAGKLGVRMINVGQYLEAGKPVASLQALDRMYVDFSLPQQELDRVKTGMRVRVTTDAYPGREFEGALTTIDPELDSATRGVGLQGTFTNADQLLRPGMFARVEVILPQEDRVLAIPATAVLSAPFGDSVYVIESESKTNGGSGLAVRQQFVRIGRARGDFVAVVAGLKGGERIAGSGVFKLRNGMAVTENNTLAPKSELNPQVPDN